MTPNPSFPNIAFIMPPLADMLPSGVTTFVREMVKGFEKHGDRFRVVEVPHGSYQATENNKKKRCLHEAAKIAKEGEEGVVSLGIGCIGGRAARTADQGEKVEKIIPLLLSYISQLVHDVRRVWRVRRQIGRRVIVTNQFGCETLPIALRLVFPFSRLIAISHTHPGRGGQAEHWVRRLVEHACYHSVADVVFNSDASRVEWSRKLRTRDIKGKVVALGSSPSDLAVPSDYPLKPEGSVDFLCVARFVGWKGQEVLVRVWKEVVARGEKRARLVLIGDGPCFEEVQKVAIESDVGDQVVFLGAKPEADRYFACADVGVLLSTEPEAFGLTLLEAMARGKPLLASRMGGIPEIVRDGDTGFLVSPENIQSVAEKVILLATSSVERYRLGANGKRRWEEYFTVPSMISRYEQNFGLNN